ncbi:helix-turn-helix domain-containing protein [Staphylococcus simulans]|uniref:HTH cro/C1-type domain-containing protein n=1 Tax=Staphylococcus simulans UMC-CNS-990 TaxID=1405498 RepID=A0ABN0PDC2_STASI|nr:helix-turn-helix transcriptional regulator [Staphylococcus simulans]ERS93594.1 hypothetical protein SSIM_05190 [Staphylococcus simulans UMC-CNS-990]
MLITSNLRVKMAEYNYSIKDVHEQTHLSRTTISNLYNGYSDGIKFYTLEKLCDLFNCTPNDLLTITYVDVYKIDFEYANEVFDKYNSDKMLFYKCELDVLINNKFYKVNVDLVIEKEDYMNSGISSGIIRLEEYENDFIGKSINTNNFIRKHLSDHLEDIILKGFSKYIEDNHILELPPTIETTF